MTNKEKRILSMAMVVIGAITMIGMIVGRIFFDIHYQAWQYMAAPIWICFFATMESRRKGK